MSTSSTKRQAVATSVRIKPEVDQMLGALSGHLHLNRTQVIEQAILRMSRQEGLIEPPTPIRLHSGTPSGDLAASVDGFAAHANDAFARIWDTPEEDAAWAHLQEVT